MASKQKKKIKGMVGIYYHESTVNKHNGRPDRTFWINFKDTAGKLRWEQCGKSSAGWNANAAQRKRYKTLEKDRAGLYKPSTQRKKEATTFDQFMKKSFLPWAQQNYKRPTDPSSRYKIWVQPEIGGLQLSQITQENIQHIIQKMRNAGRAKQTINHTIKLVRQVFKKANEWEKYDGTNPCQFIKLLKLDNARTEFLSKEKANILIAELQLTSPQTAAIATVSLYSGMRLGEILDLKWKDINKTENIITILDSKNTATRRVFITKPIEQLLNSLTTGNPDEYVFKSTKGSKVINVSKTFPRVVKKLGFNDGITDRRQKVTFHTLRHTFASWAVISGIPLYQLSKALGHKTIAMTERYAHLEPDNYRQVSEKVASFNNTVP